MVEISENNQERIRGQRGTLPVWVLGYVTATEVIFRNMCGRKRKPTSALLPHGSCATMASPVVQVIFVDESEFENEGNCYFSEHKSVEWEIHSTISYSTRSLCET